MVKKYLALFAVLVFSCSAFIVGPVFADSSQYIFPFEKAKNFLLKKTRYVASPNHINGYHDEGQGKVSVYCSRIVAGDEIIGQILYRFVHLDTDNGPKWLYLGSVKSQFID